MGMGLTQLYRLSPSWLGQNQPRRNWVEIGSAQRCWANISPRQGRSRCWPKRYFLSLLDWTWPDHFGLGQHCQAQ